VSQGTQAAQEIAGLPKPGEVLGGKFLVDKVLGAGGMGVVVAAHHMHLDQKVALKFLLPEMLAQPVVVERFTREARSAARIQSEHVTRVLDVGVLDTGAPYLVMEYLDGNDLDAEVKARGPLPIAQAVDWVLEGCEAVAEAHTKGIVHRDLKPANLFLARRPDGTALIKVLDFGISKQRVLAGAAESQVRALTQTFAQLGSPAYMPPEQLKSAKDVDERADIWALGMILQELLTGTIAFEADTLPELHVAILTHEPRGLRAGRPDAPPELEAAVSRCLQKSPAARYASVGELATALAPFGSSRAKASAAVIRRILSGGAQGAAPAPRPSRPDPTAQTVGSIPPKAGTSGVRPTESESSGTLPKPTRPAPTIPDTPSPGGSGPSFGTTPHTGPHGPPPVPHGHYPQGGHGPYPPPPPGGHPHHGMGYTMGASYAGHPPRESSNTALIVLIVLLTLIVLGMGGCGLCVCLAAASGP
jgi:serine/threonine-protein kinase